MRRKAIFWGTAIVVVILGTIGVLINFQRSHSHAVTLGTTTTKQAPASHQLNSNINSSSVVAEPITAEWASPLGDPKARVTKKSFGLYVTPQNSPVQPERFTGYHTGWDFETTSAEQNAEVLVKAFCAGTLRLKEWVNGYGGLAVESCVVKNQDITVIYGHLNIDSISPKTNDHLVIGQIIGTLGVGFSQQTNGERKHLHFGIHKGTNIVIKGYVQNSTDLSGWIDPALYLGTL